MPVARPRCRSLPSAPAAGPSGRTGEDGGVDQREVVWDGAYNVRDLGGLPLPGGGVTRSGAFYRSSSPRFMTPEGWRQAREAGARTVVDLRDDHEVAADPAPTADAARAAGLAVVRADLDGPGDHPVWRQIVEDGIGGTPLYLRPFIDAQPERVAAVVTTLARAPEGGVVFHCQVGRDRTGLIALVLLALVGVEPQAIAQDYERSGPALVPVFELMGRPDEQPHVEAVLADHGTTGRGALLAVLDGFDAEAYLRGAGVGADDVAALRRRLVG